MSASVKCNVCSDLFKTIHPKKSCYSDIKLQQQLNKCTRFDNSKSLNSTSLQTPKTLKVAVCCSANVNRSMAAHKILSENGFSVESFGVSDKVRLPAPNHQVKEFSFGTPYETIISELKAIDEDWYSSRSIMYIMERNAEIKEAPEHFQDCDHIDRFDLILCCDNYCYNVAKTFLSSSDIESNHPIYLLGIDVPDTPKLAEAWAPVLLNVVENVEKVKCKKITIHKVINEAILNDNVDIQYSIIN